jgi:hypothetical protein
MDDLGETFMKIYILVAAVLLLSCGKTNPPPSLTTVTPVTNTVTETSEQRLERTKLTWRRISEAKRDEPAAFREYMDAKAALEAETKAK